jgi:hypothetical protein
MNLNEDTENPVLRKIRKLLALATNEAAAPGEAANAMRQAQALMRAHNVTDGTLARESIGEKIVRGTRGQKPAVWEFALVKLCCSAFGARPLWTRGPKGGKGDADNGHWTFLAPRSQVELVVYAYTVLVRQLLASRAEFVAEHAHEWRYHTRVQKAAEADAFCEGFVSRLREKVSPMELEEAQRLAIENKVTDLCGPNAKSFKATRNGRGSLDSLLAGQAAGAAAHFHRATTASVPRRQLEGAA